MKPSLGKEFFEMFDKFSNFSPNFIQHAYTETYKFNSDAIYVAVSSTLFEKIKQIPEWKEYQDKVRLEPYYTKRTSTPEFRFEHEGYIIGYTARWTGSQGDAQSKRILGLKIKNDPRAYEKIPDKFSIKVYPDFKYKTGISINFHLARGGTTIQLYPKSGALEHDLEEMRTLFMAFMATFSIGKTNPRKIDFSKAERSIGFTERYVRVQRQKTATLMVGLDSLSYRLSMLFEQPIEIPANLLKSYRRDKFISVFTISIDLGEINRVSGINYAKSMTLKVYFPKDYRNTPVDSLSYHPKVEIKLYSIGPDIKASMEFYQNFLTFFLLYCRIKSTDLVTQENQYFESDFKALCFDIVSEIFSNKILTKKEMKREFGKRPEYKKALKYLSELELLEGDTNY